MQINRNITARMPLFLRVVSLYVIVGWLVLLGCYAAATINRQDEIIMVPSGIVYVKKNINYGNIVTKVIIDGEPQTFTMQRLGINLPIKYGYYDTNTDDWTTSDDAIYFGYGTALPNNQRGNTFIYGHNRDSVIGKLAYLVVGDEVTITTKNGHTFTYSYTGDLSVKPNYTSILREDPDTPRLTIMTCEGVWSLTRRLMFFDLKEAK